MTMPFMPPLSAPTPSTDIIGIPISLVDLDGAVATIIERVRAGEAQVVCVRDVHGVMLAQDDGVLMQIHHGAGLVLPDGMPLAKIARWRGHYVGRTPGADLVDHLCSASVSTGLKHYFYGGQPGVADAMARRLADRYPGMQIAGYSSPPFRPASLEVDLVAVDAIRSTGADIVWVGLSTPKQEYWMAAHVAHLPGVTLIGVGAAFDFHTGAVKRAPRWMRNYGLEWAHRLMSEPRRLWRRYLLLAPQFLFRVCCQAVSRR